jgi:TrmH family RNA methyltransferase
VPRAVFVGSEASGLTPEEVRATVTSVRVPMSRPVESLNAAVALGVVLYEAARQRNWPR